MIKNSILKSFLFLFVVLFTACQSAEETNATEDKKVGTFFFTWENEEKTDPYYGGNRVVNVQLWYPTADTSGHKAPYYYRIDEAWKGLPYWSNEDFKSVQKINTNSFIEAKVLEQKDKYPLIIFSPSLGGNLSQYTFYAEKLAKSGYFVLGINHLYESEYVFDMDQNLKPANHSFHDSLKTLEIPTQITADEYRAKKGARQKVLAEDVLFALDQLVQSNWNSYINFDRIGAFGHSMGGAAVIYASILDDRLKAIIDLDGTPPSLALEKGIAIPFLFIEDLTDYRNHKGYQKLHQRRNQFCKKNESDAFRVLFAEINHNSFLDINYHLAQSQKEKIAAKDVLEKTHYYMSGFFNRYIKDIGFEITAMSSDSMEIFAFPSKLDLSQN